MEALRNKQFIGIREDDKFLADKLYQGILNASHKQKQPEIKASELKNLKVEDDVSKIIDNLINIYELKLNDILILQNETIDKDYSGVIINDIPQTLVKLLRNISIYNTIIVSWNGLIKLLNTPNLPKVSQDDIFKKLSMTSNLYNFINNILENSVELIENLASSKHFIIEQFFKFMVVSYIIKKQIENSNFRIINLQELELFGNLLKGQLTEDTQQQLTNIKNQGPVLKSQIARVLREQNRRAPTSSTSTTQTTASSEIGEFIDLENPQYLEDFENLDWRPNREDEVILNMDNWFINDSMV